MRSKTTALILATLLLVACDELREDICEPGTAESCSCDDGAPSTRQCRGDGTGWQPCICDPADGGVDGDMDGDMDSADAAPDGEVESLSGPLLLVAPSMTVLAEEICDVDGDGTLDNSVADLGSSQAALFVAAINALTATSSDESRAMAVYLPWIDDLVGLNGSDLDAAVFRVEDAQWPPDPSDDFSGDAPFRALASDLDECGEPVPVVADIGLAGGVITGGGEGRVHIPLGDIFVQGHLSEVRGGIDPLGVEFLIRGCGYATIRELGAHHVAHSFARGLTLLEWFLSGGVPLGITAPGLQPDVDLDGDGLESFLLDEERHVVACIDGTGVLLEGRDCWQDPGMADAFSLTLQLEGVRGRLEGREPGWEYMVPTGCPAFPVEGSLFDTIPAREEVGCAGLDEACEPRAPTPCCDPTHRCSGADTVEHRCSAPCVPSPCAYNAHLGRCSAHWGNVCIPIGPDEALSECAVGSAGCTTNYGVSEGTECVELWDGAHCLERCESVPDTCPDLHYCIALAFEEGGVCIFW